MSSIIISKTIECEECEAEYKVKHDMSDRHYVVSFCSFCGCELDIEASLDDFITDENETEEDW
jgi:hypothetical protein